MGAMGVYQIFATGGAPCGGMMTKMPQTPAPFWLYYFNVDALETAMARVKDAGGQVIHGPMEVPGGSWIAHGLDPRRARCSRWSDPRADRRRGRPNRVA